MSDRVLSGALMSVPRGQKLVAVLALCLMRIRKRHIRVGIELRLQQRRRQRRDVSAE